MPRKAKIEEAPEQVAQEMETQEQGTQENEFVPSTDCPAESDFSTDDVGNVENIASEDSALQNLGAEEWEISGDPSPFPQEESAEGVADDAIPPDIFDNPMDDGGKQDLDSDLPELDDSEFEAERTEESVEPPADEPVQDAGQEVVMEKMTEHEDSPAPARTPRRRRSPAATRSVLAIDDEVQVQSVEEKEAYLWMELRNSLRSKRILTGTMGGVERTAGGTPIAVVYYKDMRIVIPASAMFLNLNEHGGSDQRDMNNRYTQILTRMLGAEIDFVVSGLDRRGGSVVASRSTAMLRKQQHYFVSSGRAGTPRVSEGQIVEARVISVGEKNMRVEVFGAEATVLARDLAWEWVDDCADYYQIGDHVLVKILRVDRDESHNLRINVSVREAIPNPAQENIKKCVVQGKYIGKVTGVDSRAIYVRLNVGVNAIAIAVHDRKTPCRKDDVSFVITRIDEEAGLAIGIITRVIKQYL